jgi:putative ABC transport system permease protein
MSTQDDEFAREIESHLELEADQLRDEGLSPGAARAAANRRFGNVVAAKERHFEAGRAVWFDRLQQDARGAWRSLRRSPMASLVAILSLAAGIGATTMTLTVRDIVFRRPPPAYADPERLSEIQVGTSASPIMPIGNPVPSPLFTRWQASLGSSIAGAISLGQRTVRTSDRREAISIRSATPNLLTVLGVEPLLGVGFDKIGASAARESSVVLSHRVWLQLFDGRADAIGQTVWIDDHALTVAGVLPPRFWFSDMGSPIWTTFDPSRVPHGSPVALTVVVRRGHGESAPMLEAKLKPALDAYAAELPTSQGPLLVRASGIEGTPMGKQMSFVLPYVLGTAVLLTLLIACANVATLLMARWTAREHEIAIRASIGASRARIVRSLLAESVVIALCGALLGAGVTVGLNALIAYRAGGGAFFDLSVDWGIMLKAAAIALAAGVITGILPALHETRRLNRNPLRVLAGSDRARQRWRHALVIAEITMTIALLVVSATMIEGYFRIAGSDLGFATAPLMTARVENPGGVATARLTDVLSQIPGVTAASASTSIPMGAGGGRVPVTASPTSEPVVADRGEIDDRFFATLGVRVVAGRGFTRAEARESRTAIVNQVLVERLFPGRDPIGAQVLIDQVPHEVVGVVANYANTPMRAAFPPPRVFVPLPSSNARRMAFLLRIEGNPSDLMRRLRDDVGRLGDGTSVTETETMTHILDIMGREMLTGTAPLMPLVTIGVLLTTAGIYGVLAFAIARRSRELAIRVAVGAGSGNIVRLVFAHTAWLVSIGSLAGLIVMVGLARVVRAGGGAGSIWDPPLMAFVLPIALVFVIGAMATWVPSRRALAIDPVVLLREQ